MVNTDDDEQNASVFNESAVTQRTPPNSTEAPLNVQTQKPAPVPRGFETVVKKKVVCRKCGIKDGETKLYCRQCFMPFHVTCTKQRVDIKVVQAGKWLCDPCIIALKNEKPASVSSLKSTKNSKLVDLGNELPDRMTESETARQTRSQTLAKQQQQGGNPGTSSKAISEGVVDLSQIMSNIDLESTKRRGASMSGRSSQGSRNSTKQQLELIAAEEKLQLERFEAQIEREERFFNAKQELLRKKYDVLEAGSRSGSIGIISSESESQRRASLDKWTKDAAKVSFQKKAKNVPSESSSEESIKDAPAPRKILKSRKVRSAKDYNIQNDNNRSRCNDKMDPSLAFLCGRATEQEFLDSTLGSNSSIVRRLRLSKSQIQARMVIPKEIPSFSGDPQYWPQFIAAFANSTHQCGFTAEENMARLNKCLKGDAYDAVRTDLLFPSSLPTALSTLHMLYGRPEIIFNAAMEQVRQSPPVKMEKLESIVGFSMRVKSFCDTVKTAGMPEYLNNPTLLAELVEKLPSTMKMEWGRYRRKAELKNPIISTEVFNKWLRENAEVASCLSTQLSKPLNTYASVKKPPKSGAFHGAHDVEVSEQPRQHTEYRCPFCKSQAHAARKCRDFERLTSKQRWNKVRQRNLCVSCLGKHWIRDCNDKKPCGVDGCLQQHNPLLHYPSKPSNVTSKESSTMRSEQSNLRTGASTSLEFTPSTSKHIMKDNQKHVSVHYKPQLRSFYQILPVVLHGPNGRSVKTHAFLDGGSTVTLLEQSIADELGLEGISEKLTLKWTNKITREEPESCRVNLKISGLAIDEKFHLNDVRTTAELALPAQGINLELLNEFPHLKGLNIATYERIQPTILIGLDNFQLMVAQKTVVGEWMEPVAIQTRIGWTLLGGGSNTHNTTSVNCHTTTDNQLQDLVKHFFTLESLGVRILNAQVESHEDARARKLLAENVKKIEAEERYEAGLLWKADEIKLPDSRKMAMSRLLGFERKLSRNPKLWEAVNTQIQDYEAKGFLQRLTKREASAHTPRTWYLPIFSVTNPNKPAKMRLVWDAAATVDGTSLNSHLLTGPDLLENLVGVLLRFREHRVAVSGDIRQMFHQIRIRREDQDAQRCLWRPDKDAEISTFRMTVMTFGAACSPSIAQFVKNQHASQYERDYPRAVEAIHRRHYVDDYIDSFESVAECVQVTKDVTMIHRRGGFELRNFVSNDPEVLRALSISLMEQEKTFSEQESSTTILGMRWQISDDTLRFRVNRQRIGEDLLKATTPPTKREVLRLLMMIFDPLGLLGFFILQGKLMLKEVWRSGVDWDEHIQPKQMSKWSEWMHSLDIIETVEVPRCYFKSRDAGRFELHTFVDASEQAAAAVVYIVNVRLDGHREIAFISSKTKIAPNKSISIPRLELQAAVIGARLANSIKKQQSIQIDQTYFWSDSKNVLCWLRSPKTFKPFVAFRVGEILETTNTYEWRWVPSKQNVADEATKWRISTAYCVPKFWFTGPEFLQQSSEYWPVEKCFDDQTAEDDEVRCLHVSMETSSSLTVDVTKYSDFARLVRVQVYVLRLFYRRRDFRRPILPEEIEEATNYLIRSVQQKAYYVNSDWKNLKEGKSLEIHSTLRKLSPFMDSRSIIRSRSRLRKADYLSYEQKYPILLPPKNPFTDLLVKATHENFYHENHSTVLNELHQKYHIPKLRSCLMSVRAKCMKCHIRDARPEVPEMADLPMSRIAARLRPFTYVGVDYFGPIMVKIGRRLEKRWGVIFTCLTTRAIHLELASSLSTDSFLLMLRAFISRRGMPREIYSDNGTNFKGAEAELQKLLKTHLQQKVQESYANIGWKFNPPAAPHMGGAWERLIRSVKNGLAYALPQRNPSEELLRCVLVEIEGVVNSRPLTYVETDADSLEALTPNHFLLGASSGTKPYGEFTDDVHILRTEWKRQQQIIGAFWTRWIGEYLPFISTRTRWYDKVTPLKNGDVVAIVLSETPYSWQLGRIEAVTRSADGNVRQALVKTATGMLTRPASKLAVLVKEPKKLSDTVESSTGGSVADG